MAIPQDPAFDNTLAFFREGYNFIGNRCRRLDTDIFATRIMMRQVVCMRGEAAARRFYDGSSFTRVGAMPQTTLRLLQRKGSVQLLDGAAHAQRKQLFLDMATPGEAARLGDCFDRHWRAKLPDWRQRGHIVLRDAMVDILCAAACEWSGIPLEKAERAGLGRALAAMVDGAGSVGPRKWRGVALRLRVERRLRRLVSDVRGGRFLPGSATPLARIAAFHDANGKLLDTRSAAVELLNILRPTVAVAWFITFAGLALHEHPTWRDTLRNDSNGKFTIAFAQEVRRYYPFFPVIGGRVRHPFDFAGHHFATGDWVLLGLYATNHDPRLWRDPGRFRPERFLKWRRSGYDLIPQGARDYRTDHRCPGESLTIELLDRALAMLASQLRYEVPEQDLRISPNRSPTLPKSGLILTLQS
ncbi:cytochrome P450 [Dongia soli]|uniref:Cytochrome P450 n=1 Tax=Dongia soli TaxID=600628 RepID=A0ABU5EF41_9PROT|nr:cytochrome P450 [Dongia soli]MDY0884629.1 cytochrome P450 [Dongia soli]